MAIEPANNIVKISARRLKPFWRYSQQERDEIFDYLSEGNSKDDLAMQLLERFSEDDLRVLLNEIEERRLDRIDNKGR